MHFDRPHRAFYFPKPLKFDLQHHLLRAMDVVDYHSQALGVRLATLTRPLIDQELSVVFQRNCSVI
ncbi:MAG: hypothetical protein EBR17_04585 [Betaproteobacteria bacterium]|nr:hypothetical protein [Betaproteobacteria bacterium]NBX88993.1 hypothetical protein [Betaproteobacteria bacterium]